MERLKLLNILDTYYDLTKLKNKKRQGWLYWNVSADRIESIAEHIFGAQQLAWLIYSEANLDLDIYKVISMLSLHETEEITIGDITPFDKVTPEEKLSRGEKAVEKTFDKLSKKNMMIDLVKEFDIHDTKEGKFAFLCDKLECDLQAKKYYENGYVNIDNASSIVKDNEKTKAYEKQGITDVGEIFLRNDEGKYAGTVFEEIANFIREYRV